MPNDQIQIGGLVDGFTRQEDDQIEKYSRVIMLRVDKADPYYSQLEKEVLMSVKRDLQAKRIPPNARIPSRLQHPFGYVKKSHENGLRWFDAARSYFAPGSWTSSGGSFKLAEDAGYNIASILTAISRKNPRAVFLEIGAGYAGFKSGRLVGINKLVQVAGSELGNRIHIHFTNLTPWHANLPDGVTEHPGYVARDINHLENESQLHLG